MQLFPSRWLSSSSKTSPPPDDFLATSTEGWWAAVETRRSPSAPKPDNLAGIRRQMCRLLQDCPGTARDSVLASLKRAYTADEAWMLRSNVYQCIAHRHGESEARERVNGLIPHFQDLMPASRLRPI
ncbi:hypothetical protein [Caenimonas aquaedulcis]|uniref:Uncharacterized protein n=1 Tax=Caenimonas aquaedulcis TaxID=2793270 RepID=A0A931H3Q8_9BURK|nr:hypothetical protein [Caenimonas aquaedulcis]MBG9387938.1 hypothetical protein [Caenimonas aquaedulcis]